MNKIKETFREFKLSSFAIDNGTSVFLITLMIILFGIQSYISMPKELYPDASLPTIYINTPYFGNSAVEIENLVTRPLEKEIESINEIKTVNSTSVQDFSVIIAEFISDVEMSDAVVKIKDAVDKAKTELPDDLTEEPLIQEIKFNELPVMTINVSGDFNQEDLRRHAEYVQDKIESLREVSKVDIKGAQEREVKVNVDAITMQSLQISFNDIENAIKSENLTMSAGEIINNDFKRAVRIVGQFKNVDELKNIIIKSERQRPIYLKDIANVEFGWEDQTTIARVDAKPVISLDIIKKKGENLLSAADKIYDIVDDAERNLPDGITLSYFNDLSIDTRLQVNNLENSIISGVILVVLVLLFFLGIRNASFVGLAIPLSMLMGILILNIAGTTLNIVVLFALIIALGLLVDNAIVIVENIYRFRQQKYGGAMAAKAGAGEVAIPIITSTMTTLAAFLPLAFWPGIMGQFMQYLPITLIIVLSSSLFVALVINTVFTSSFMNVEKEKEDVFHYRRKRKNMLIGIGIMACLSIVGHLSSAIWLRNMFIITIVLVLINFFVFKPGSRLFQSKLLPFLERVYNKFIRWALGGIKPYLIFIGTFLLLIATIFLLGLRAPKIGLFPEADPKYVNVFVDLPLGKDITATFDITQEIELKIENVLEGRRHIVESVMTQIGENTADPNGPPEPGVTPNKARITITFVKTEDRDGISTAEIMDDVRKEIRDFPGVSVFVAQNPSGPPSGKPLNIDLKSENLDSLIVFSKQLVNNINDLGIDGIEELQSDVKLGKPELLINVNRDAARRYELSTFNIANTIRTAVFGKEVSKLKDGDEEYPIMVRIDENNRNSISDLINQKVTFRNPANGQIVQVPISAVADFEYSSTYSSIKRKNGERLISIFSNILEGYNANEIVAYLKEKIAEMDIPANVEYVFSGEQEQQAEDMAFLSRAFLIAVFFIFIILVAQFNSFISPFIIVLSILFSTIGVFLGYIVTGSDVFIVMSGIGIISLAGIVVNNAIVLIDYINLLIREKSKELGTSGMKGMTPSQVKESIILGGATRLRPVLLTAITTILGLVPLATGININFATFISDFDPQYFSGGDNAAVWGPMAWTVIYGLTFATFLTLIVVPVMYWLAYKMKSGFSNLSNLLKFK